MNASIIIPALFVAAISAVIVVYVLNLIISAFGGSPLAFVERHFFRRKQQILRQVDEASVPLPQQEIIRLCKSAFYLNTLHFNPGLIDAVYNHNLGVLNRLVNIAAERSAHLPNLPVVESLIATRAELSRARFEVAQTMRKLRSKKDKDGSRSETPGWAMAEFSKKSAEIKQKLDGNRKSLAVQLGELISLLSKLPAESQITYH